MAGPEPAADATADSVARAAWRADLLSAPELLEFGRHLAALHRIGPGTGGSRLLRRLRRNERRLREIHRLLSHAVASSKDMTPAEEWILDNFYLVQEQVHAARRNFPRRYSRELPCLIDDPAPGMPRVYDIARQLVIHGDGRVGAGSLREFVGAYQEHTVLDLGELWAIPIMLALVLVEHLGNLGDRAVEVRKDRSLAASWAERLTIVARESPGDLILTVADMVRSSPPRTSAFVAEFSRRLTGHERMLAVPLGWMERWLAESGWTLGDMVRADHEQQAADGISVSNSIGSFRFLAATDWKMAVEEMSIVDTALREDPAGAYARMDFRSRDGYRHAIEEMARATGSRELEVARMALTLARASNLPADQPESHVGYYLVDAGLSRMSGDTALLRRRLGTSGPAPDSLAGLYVAGIAAGSTATTMGLLQFVDTGAASAGLHAAMFGLLLLVASQAVTIAVNRLVALFARPTAMPRMDFSTGIPAGERTLVVVPAMLASRSHVDELLALLEVRFLGNRDEHIQFALLTDFLDADAETEPGDQALVEQAQLGIEGLNRTYARAGHDLFFLLHRPRLWNEAEGRWMGFERKRGKLADLNAFLRGQGPQRFSTIVGDETDLAQVRYVLTLDADTELPRDAARQLIATLAHPLNRPHLDPSTRLVSRGYAILQPRVAISPLGKSRYARLWGGEAGLDPYTGLVSDTYQDAFGEGSFVGKGLYDVDAVSRVLEGRMPHNRVLSHDLLEGCYARCALVSDVQLLEGYPERYLADADRRHRWVRGDWQIGGWLRRKVPAETGRERNPLNVLSQWKILDNMRRSLHAPAALALLMTGWTLDEMALGITLSVLGLLFGPMLLDAALDIATAPRGSAWRASIADTGATLRRSLAQGLFGLACLPHEATFSLDAIVRSLWRLMISRRRLLEWNPASGSAPVGRANRSAYRRAMWSGPVFGLAGLFLVMAGSGANAVLAVPIVGAWMISPWLAWWLSRPLPPAQTSLTKAESRFLGRTARKTWAFFERFVGPGENWLPPDNFQEEPDARVAHRTSPTNMGLAALANLAAHDLGYLGTGQLLERTGHTLETMLRLERSQGHFYNWYDTQTLAPLMPRYISAVDSGNLAGHLLTLRAGLLQLRDRPILDRCVFAGLRDTFAVLADRGAFAGRVEMTRFDTMVTEACERPPANVLEFRDELLALLAAARDVEMAVARLPRLQEWALRLEAHCQEALGELAFYLPWTAESAGSPPEPAALGAAMPTLASLADSNGWNASGGQHDAAAAETRQREQARERARARIELAERLADICAELSQPDFDCLFDRARHLFAIGYNVGERKRDASYYDLLASEARLASFVAISQGGIPQDAWFALGRIVSRIRQRGVLLSWDGSMFEYLMPHLIMPSYPGTLINESCCAAIGRQIEYGRERGIPWGVSESGYNAVDAQRNYQYRAFGVPGLGLRRGLGEDVVVAPYATCLALLFTPSEAVANLARLSADGVEGDYGFYEAVDYTPSRLPRGDKRSIVRSYMAHHQAMSLVAISGALLNRPMQRRFESEPLFKSSLLLLHEKTRTTASVQPRIDSGPGVGALPRSPEPALRTFSSANTPIPEAHLLSNGRYHVMVTNAGGGYSRWKDIAITRWREDSTCDNWGVFCYLRDLAASRVWSVTHQPSLGRADNYEAVFTEGRAEFRRRTLEIESFCEVAVSPEDDVELRRIRITNWSRAPKRLDVTSYAELVLESPAADALHPAFSKLFLQTEILPERGAILCSRRPRFPGESTPWIFHLMAVHGGSAQATSYETDRARFIGRRRTAADPVAMEEAGPLSGTAGAVLDPIASIRNEFVLAPDESVVVDLVFGYAPSRDGCLALCEKYRDKRLANRVSGLAWTHGQMVLRQINASEAQAQVFGRLASVILYANASMRADLRTLDANRRGQSGLWGYGVSGDLPIVILRLGSAANRDLARQLIQAHAYWRMRGLAVDLVIWNEDHGGYRQVLNDEIFGLLAAEGETSIVDRPGGIFLRTADQVSDEDRTLFLSVARLVVTDAASLEDQIKRRGFVAPGRGAVDVRPRRPVASRSGSERANLQFFNGTGGFDANRQEYVILQTPPSPWVNVLANPDFGTVISECGSAYTWYENAHEYRLTPWSNDPVSDRSGEMFYLRDEASGYFWSPAGGPAGASGSHVCRHGFGYSIFEHEEEGIRSELCVFVAHRSAVKYSVLRLKKVPAERRRLSVTGYVEWVLGDLRHKTAMHVVTAGDSQVGILARNAYNTEFPDRYAFFDAEPRPTSITGDRTEFIGRNGSLTSPAALSQPRLSGRLGPGLDPCAALQVQVQLAPGAETELVFRLGAANSKGAAETLIRTARGAVAARAALAEIAQYWTYTLGALRIETPDPALDLLANGWLLYQAISSRLWGRSGFYQSGGAFGFRDQLQDCMALIHADPGLLHRQLMKSAGRQFAEGDVQHWWHPPGGRGVRTHCSDDLLWLPMATARYVLSTGDTGILQEQATFLEGRPLQPADESYYDMPRVTETRANLYQHCVRAISRSLRFGSHGLPLIGSGDWNDGMNRVGPEGRGESVWLAFFLFRVLKDFSEVSRLVGDFAFAETCETTASALRSSVDAAWDGEWYRRAYFDDGTPLGSSQNAECRIDSIAQSWAVLSGAASEDRVTRAMESAWHMLVDRQPGVVPLLDPPFDSSALHPGYIRGYAPGVRENGGQYNHAAIWLAMACASRGQGDRAYDILRLVSPIERSLTPETVSCYRVEPYVVAADVYAHGHHLGRGGWTWYTGSAGWMYRLITESMLGIQRRGSQLHFHPCVPPAWATFRVLYRYGETRYDIRFTRSPAQKDPISVRVDGAEPAQFLALVDDHRDHAVDVTIP